MKDPTYIDYRYVVRIAVRDNIIPKSVRCQQCGRSDTRIVGHHPDYTEALCVTWLCQRCHSRHHNLGWCVLYNNNKRRNKTRLQRKYKRRIRTLHVRSETIRREFPLLYDVEIFLRDTERETQCNDDFLWLTRTVENLHAVSGRNKLFGFLDND